MPSGKVPLETTHVRHAQTVTRPTNLDPLGAHCVKRVNLAMTKENVTIVTWVTPDAAKKTTVLHADVVMLVKPQQKKVRPLAKNAMWVNSVVPKVPVPHVQPVNTKTVKVKANALNVQKEKSTSILKHRAVDAI